MATGGKAPQDYVPAIVASLFAPVQGNPPAESYVAHLQTFEGQSGTPQRKARFLIIAAMNDGRYRLHKSKENTNGTFSIGKTWNLEELRSVEVAKRLVPGANSPQPLEFTLGMNQKTYLYETELPSSQQAAFLVKMVRCWRGYMAGRGVQDLVLVGFSVDTSSSTSNPAPARSTTPSRPTTANSSVSYQSQVVPSSRSDREGFSSSASSAGPPRPPSSHSMRQGSAQQSMQMAPPVRPTTANSIRTVASNYSQQPPSSPPTNSGRRPSAPSSIASGTTGLGLAFRGPSPIPPTQQQSTPPPRPPSSGGRNGSTSSPGPFKSVRNGSTSSLDPIKPLRSGSAASAGPPVREGERTRNLSTSSTTSATPGRSTPVPIPRRGSPPPSIFSASTSGPGASTNGNGPTIVAPQPRKPAVRVEELVDDDTVMTNVEEMLEGFEWRGGQSGGAGYSTGGKGKADEIEKRLVGELKALEAASIYAIMESDDRVTFVIKHLDDALAELDKLDLMVGLYKSQLNLMTDDIAHIEGQNRGLQVQTSNQRMLLSELDNLLETIHIPDSDLTALSMESMETAAGVARLETASVSLYKALLSTRDTAVGDMAAASERGEEYRAKSSLFCKRIFDRLTMMFKLEVDSILNPKGGSNSPTELPSHAAMEEALGRFCGLMLFVKEIDYARYQQICAAYFTAVSDLYRIEIQGLMSTLRGQLRKPTEEELEATFTGSGQSPTIRQQSMRRAGTLIRSPIEGGSRSKDPSGKLYAGDALDRILSQLNPRTLDEQGFISDFLNINSLDASITFAEYMQLEAYFRRGAKTYLASQQGNFKDIKAALELVFGFVESELRQWIDGALQKDSMQIIGVLAALDRAIDQGQRDGNDFLLKILNKQHQKALALLERSIKEQIKAIEQTKLTLKKRKGVVPFVQVFPIFVSRVEGQLEGADELNIRQLTNANYERIVTTIFDCLQQMAKMDGEGHGVAAEDKDQLNYHVIIIENMHHIVAVFSKQSVPALATFVTQAKEKYTQNLDLYIRLVLRRPFSRAMDFFGGLEQLLRTTPPTEVSLHSAYTKSSVRRVLGDLRPKDLRKAIDALYKRVDKHFGDVTNPSAEHTVVIKTVWKACEEEMQRLTGAWRSLVDKCYPDDKVGFEFTRDDVTDFFAKARASQ